ISGIANPIRSIASAMRRLSDGDLDIDIPYAVNRKEHAGYGKKQGHRCNRGRQEESGLCGITARGNKAFCLVENESDQIRH
ncbi:HAMP domain-containing protein, partial [Rhizobium ruizarguesonis]